MSNPALVASEAAGESSLKPIRSYSRRVAVSIFAYFLVAGAVFGTMGVLRAIDWWYWLNDLHYFIKAADYLFDNGRRDFLYYPELRNAITDYTAPNWETFPFPATVAILFWPTAHMDYATGRWIILGISIASGLLIAFMAYRWSRDLLFALLIVLAHASLYTLYEAYRFSQFAPIIALAYCGALLSLDAKRPVRAGIIIGLLALKPSVAAAPFIYLLGRRNLRGVLPAALLGFILVLAIPYFVVGPDGIRAYIELLGRYRAESLKLDGIITAGAGWMLNWNGFVGKITSSDLSIWSVLPFYAVTAIVMVRVWLRGDLFDSWYASTLATLLIVPHAVFYDWVILLGVAPFAVYHRRSAVLLVLSLALHLAVSLDSYIILNTSVFDRFFFSTTPIAAAIMLYLALAPLPKQYAVVGREEVVAVPVEAVEPVLA